MPLPKSLAEPPGLGRETLDRGLEASYSSGHWPRSHRAMRWQAGNQPVRYS